MIKYYKYGFGRTSDYVNEEIRIGRISREEGIKLVEKYDSIFGDKYVGVQGSGSFPFIGSNTAGDMSLRTSDSRVGVSLGSPPTGLGLSGGM